MNVWSRQVKQTLLCVSDNKINDKFYWQLKKLLTFELNNGQFLIISTDSTHNLNINWNKNE